jgi:hypothetical protein
MPDGFVPADEGYVGTVHAGLFWLGTGDPAYLERARRTCWWFIDHIAEKEAKGEVPNWGPWFGSYGCIMLAEYYQMTGDRSILPGLELAAKQIARGQMPSGGWTHGYFDGYHAGYGELNNAGLACWIALVLSKECGVKVDERALARAEHFFGRFAVPLCSAYGDHAWRLEGYRAHNGHMGMMAVAHRLEGNDAIAEKYTLKVVRAFDRIEDGHTGCYFSLVWSQIAASLAPAAEYRRAMDQFGWYYALARTPRGGFLCQYGGDNLQRTGGEYTDVGPNMTTGGIGLGLVAPRRHLRILGATKSVFLRDDLPPALQEARRLHQANDWDACQAAVDAFLARKHLDRETVRLAHELKDKSRYVQEDVEGTLARLMSMATVSFRLDIRTYEIYLMRRPLMKLLGERDSRLEAIAAVLQDKDGPNYKRGKEYYDACRILKAQANEPWWIYGRMAKQATREIVPNRIESPWDDLVDTTAEKNAFKIYTVDKGAGEPHDWTGAAFDDSAWPHTMPRGDTRRFDTLLMRSSFSLSGREPAKLRLVVDTKLPGGTKVFINGEEVLDADSPLKGTADLLPTVTRLLRNGRNVLSIRASGKLSLPKIKLMAPRTDLPESFAWSRDPGRDWEIRKYVAMRRRPEPYYDPAADDRTLKEVLKDMGRTPVFPPDLYNSLERFRALVAEAERPAEAARLLRSSSWGGRLAGLTLIHEALALPNVRRKPKEERNALNAAYKARFAACMAVFRKITPLLRDPNPLVRQRAAEIMERFGESARAAIPTLVALISDTSEDWWVRRAAWGALWKMNPDERTREKLTRLVLRDASSPMRNLGLKQTIDIKDEAARIEALRTYKDELVAYVFDAPLSMWTRHTRRKVAFKLKELGRDAIRPHVDRFFEALSHPRGGALDGSIEILAWFGEEVLDKLETLADGKDEAVRVNAIATLARIAATDDVGPGIKTRIIKRLESIATSGDSAPAKAARKGLKEIAAGKDNKG